MRPEPFDGVTAVLGAPVGWDVSKHGPCSGLPVSCLDGVCVSRWSLTWRERFAVLFGRRVRAHVASGATQPPMFLSVWKN